MNYIISDEELKAMLKSIAKVSVNETDPIIDDTIFAFKLSKQPVQTLDRDKVEELLEKYTDEYATQITIGKYREWLKLRRRYADQILRLIPQQPTESTKDIFIKIFKELYNGYKVAGIVDLELSEREYELISLVIKDFLLCLEDEHSEDDFKDLLNLYKGEK